MAHSLNNESANLDDDIENIHNVRIGDRSDTFIHASDFEPNDIGRTEDDSPFVLLGGNTTFITFTKTF